MSHPRNVLCSASCPPTVSLLSESGSSCFRDLDGCSGQNGVWMTNRAALFARSIQCSSSTVMVMMLLMNPCIDDHLDVMSTAKGSTVARWLVNCFFHPVGVRIGVMSLGHLCPKIRPGVDFFLGLLSMH